MTDHQTPDAVILLSRGGTGAAAREAAQRLAAAMQLRLPGCQLIVAFIDKAAPSLPEALDRCIAARSIVVLPLLAPDEPALVRWLQKVAMRWQARQGSAGAAVPAIRFAPGPMLAEPLADLACEQVYQALQAEEVSESAGPQWQHDPIAWSSVPAHTHHALICMGPRCTAKGAVAVWEAAGDATKASPALQGRLRPLQTSCQYPCNHGPLIIMYPEGVWYGPLDARQVEDLLHAHVFGDRCAAAETVHRLKSEAS